MGTKDWGKGPQKLAEFFQRYKFVLLMLVIGMILMLWPSKKDNTAQTVVTEGTLAFDLEENEKRIEQTLSKIEGAGEVSLVLTVKSSSEQVYATDTEYRQDGEDREEQNTTVLISSGSGEKTPAVVRQLYPVYQGALVVCDGGDDPAVKLVITQAVAALTGLRSDKITVCK